MPKSSRRTSAPATPADDQLRSTARSSLTLQAEDYLKAIYELERPADSPAGTNDIAASLGVAAASVSGMIQRLARLGLVKAERYRGAKLTAAGRAAALQLIRRHRIIESYLVNRLGFGWDDVHDEAERLEHAASDELITRMAEAIGNPTEDPHGAPIPSPTGEVDETRLSSIADLAVGATARVVRVSDRDPKFLRYLGGLGVKPGATIMVESREPYEGPITLAIGKAKHALGAEAAARVYVRR